MSPLRLLWMVHRNLDRRRLASVLTTLSVALGVGLFAAIVSMRRAVEDGFQRSASVCDTVVGAKGSPLELVLNSLYHLGTSPGNVPFALYEELHAKGGVEWAVPIGVGDSYREARIVGVTDTLFERVELPGYGRLRLAGGRFFDFDHETLVRFHDELEAHFGVGGETDHAHDHGAEAHGERAWFVAVIGAEVAERTGLGLGDHFVPAHDVSAGGEEHEEAETEVIGILEPTGTPFDRAIYIPLGAFYAVSGHQPKEEEQLGSALDPLGVSAILLDLKKGFYTPRIRYEINSRQDAMAAIPLIEVNKLFAVVGNVDQALRLVAVLVVAVALIGVLVAIYNTMGARRKEFAILRALGAHRVTVLALVMAESAAIALAGGLLGLLLAALGLAYGGDLVQEQTGVPVSMLPGWEELLLIPAVALVGALAGLVPALSAYRTEAARHLASGN